MSSHHLWLYGTILGLLLDVIVQVDAFNLGTIFGTRFTHSRNRYPIDPYKSTADGYIYAQRYGPHGKDLIHALSFGHEHHANDVIPGNQKPSRPGHWIKYAPKRRLPVIAPFGTEGFELSEELRRRRDRDEERRKRDRERKGVEKDFG